MLGVAWFVGFFMVSGMKDFFLHCATFNSAMPLQGA